MIQVITVQILYACILMTHTVEEIKLLQLLINRLDMTLRIIVVG
jgi:hypothetical protein